MTLSKVGLTVRTGVTGWNGFRANELLTPGGSVAFMTHAYNINIVFGIGGAISFSPMTNLAYNMSVGSATSVTVRKGGGADTAIATTVRLYVPFIYTRNGDTLELWHNGNLIYAYPSPLVTDEFVYFAGFNNNSFAAIGSIAGQGITKNVTGGPQTNDAIVSDWYLPSALESGGGGAPLFTGIRGAGRLGT